MRGQVQVSLRNSAGGSGLRGWWKRLALLFAMAVSGGSVAGYVALYVTVNGLAPYPAVPGLGRGAAAVKRACR
jgi:hypothetical protein